MEDRPRSHGAFVGLLFAAMAAATLAASVLGVLATFIIDDFGISRGTLGWVVSVNVIVAALLSPFAGALTDRLGGRRALLVVFLTSAASFAVLGLAPALAVLFIGSAMAAVSQAGGNPSTNSLIGEFLPPGRRGIVTGIKQSGVQAGITIAGLTLPTIAITLGWRWAMLIVAAGPLIAAGVAAVVIPHDTADRAAQRNVAGRTPPSMRWLAAYGGVFGFAGAVTFYVPLFAEESLGLDPRIGGAAIALGGVVAFAARIGWARFAEVRRTFRMPLAAMAGLGILAGGAFLGATSLTWLLWIGAALTGISTSAWNSVGMLAVIEDSGASTGRASGVVLFGFLTGLGIGPPVYGAIVDATGSYTTVWLLSMAACALALAPIAAWSRSEVRTGRTVR